MANNQGIYFGYNPPFWSGQQNIMSRQEDERLIKNDLMQLLLTSPGERIYQPTFGTIIQSSLFEPIDGNTAMTIRQNVVDQIAIFEPRVIVQDVTVVTNESQNTVKISVIVAPKYDPLTNYLVELTLNTQG